MKLESWARGEWSGSASSSYRLWAPIRDFLIEKSGHKCSECGWDKVNPSTGKVPLEIDHIDGDSENHRINNLKVLCPNCHSLTSTFKSLNHGNSKRVNRHVKNQLAIDESSIRRKIEREQKAKLRVEEKEQNSKSIIPKRFCECGKEISYRSTFCKECHYDNATEKANLSYPPILEMLEEIHKLGTLQYSKILGKSDAAIRKHLITRGIDRAEIRKKKIQKVTICYCGAKLNDFEISQNVKSCHKHQAKNNNYPPVDEIISGIEKLGWKAYADSINSKYASTIRGYLKRCGIDTTKISKLE